MRNSSLHSPDRAAEKPPIFPPFHAIVYYAAIRQRLRGGEGGGARVAAKIKGAPLLLLAAAIDSSMALKRKQKKGKTRFQKAPPLAAPLHRSPCELFQTGKLQPSKKLQRQSDNRKREIIGLTWLEGWRRLRWRRYGRVVKETCSRFFFLLLSSSSPLVGFRPLPPSF